MSLLGSVGYVGYMVWVDRHPAEQFEPDPTKKTLVILGMLAIHEGCRSWWQLITCRRYWLGLRLPAQEA
jgi:hypothetical protein